MKKVEIYVSLLEDDEGAARPTQAEVLGDNLYKLLPTPDYGNEDEVWEFVPGTIVRCEPRRSLFDSKKKFLLAVEEAKIFLN